MSAVLNVSNLGVNFQGTDLFSGITFVVNKKDRIGLVGKNGVGKSTILKIIAGVQQATSGQVDRQGDVEVGYLPQEFNYNSERTVLDETRRAFEKLITTQNRIEEINKELGEREDYESESYQEIIEELNHLYEVLNHLDADKSDSKIERVLKGLGFVEEDFNRPLTEFSGGWQMRVELAKLILAKPQVLLLDEPTNHLDIESILWLETFFKEYDGALIMISHDRMFLDNVTNRTIEIVHGRIYDYKVSYSKFLNLREERLQQQESAYKNQQAYIKQQERFIERFRAKNTKAKQVQSKIKALDKIERVQFDELDTSEITFRFPPPPRSGELVAEAKDAFKAYGEKDVLNELNFKILRGERVAFVGKNGMGKSTLVKLLVGEESGTAGEVKLGINVELGYYAQVQENTLNHKRTVLQTLDDIATGEWSKEYRLRALLGSFLFRDEDMDKKVSVLSGGEKSRLALARLLLKENNLLILDEPTNHLDLASKDVLKQALRDYKGTLILVSHDRAFLQGLTERTFEFKHGKIKEHVGNIDDFLAHHHVDSFRAFEADTDKTRAENEPSKKNSQNKKDYLEKKERKNRLRTLQKEVRGLEKRMEQMEAELADMEAKMADPEFYEQNPKESKELFFKHGELKQRMDQKMQTWEKLSLEKEELEKQE